MCTSETGRRTSKQRGSLRSSEEGSSCGSKKSLIDRREDPKAKRGVSDAQKNVKDRGGEDLQFILESLSGRDDDFRDKEEGLKGMEKASKTGRRAWGKQNSLKCMENGLKDQGLKAMEKGIKGKDDGFGTLFFATDALLSAFDVYLTASETIRDPPSYI